MKFNEITTEEKVRLDPKCWTGKKIGNPKTKVKGGVRVNNCVPAESINEFAPANNPNGGNYLKALASAWYNDTFNTGDLHKGIKSQEDVERILERGIHCGDGKIRKYSIGYNANFDGVEIQSDDHYEYSDYDDAGNDIDSRTGKPWGPYDVVEFGDNELDESVSEGSKYKCSCHPGDADPDCPVHGLEPMEVGDALDVKKGVAEEYNPEYDDEAGMADNNLSTLRRAVEGLDDLIDSGDNLPEWCQEKIAVAKSMLVAVWDYMESADDSEEEDPEVDEMFEAMQELAEEMAAKNGVSVDAVWESLEALDDHMLYETAAWRRKEGKSKSGGLNAKGVASYRRENPGSKLQTAVTTKPSKLKPGSKAAKRRKSFCARMSGVKGPMKKPNGKPTRKALALRKWNC